MQKITNFIVKKKKLQRKSKECYKSRDIDEYKLNLVKIFKLKPTAAHSYCKFCKMYKNSSKKYENNSILLQRKLLKIKLNSVE